MARPNASVEAVQGGLSNASVTPSGTSLLVVSVPSGLAELDYTGKAYGALSEVEADGITPQFDIDNNVLVYEHIKDFYKNGNAVLFVLPVDETQTLTEILTEGGADYNKLDALITQEQGAIKLIGFALNPEATAKTNEAGEASDIATAIPLAQSFRDKHALRVRYFNVILEHRNFTDTLTDASDLTQKTSPNISVTNARSAERVAALTTDGITVASEYSAIMPALIMILIYIATRKIASIADNLLDVLHDKAYVFPYRYPNKDGFYFGKDMTCAPTSDDYHRISRSRTVSKAMEITYNVLFNEIEHDKLLDATTGELRTADRVELENNILNAITTEMMQSGTEEISNVTVTIPTGQNILATGKLRTEIQVQPKGITTTLTATIGYAVSL